MSEQVFQLLHQSIKEEPAEHTLTDNDTAVPLPEAQQQQPYRDEPKGDDEPADNDTEVFRTEVDEERKKKGRRSQRSRQRYNRRMEQARSPSREEYD